MSDTSTPDTKSSATDSAPPPGGPYQGFFFLLRESGIAVGLQEILDFYRAIERGMGQDLENLFVLARLVFVKRPEQLDTFERAFALYFYDLELPRVAEGDPELLQTPEFLRWLQQAIQRAEVPPYALWQMPPEELMKRFWDTVREQMEEHHGGKRWVGTGGTSPFGHSGFSKGGVRVHGESRNRSALKVIGERRYVDYSDATTLQGHNIRQALGMLRHMKPGGPRNELDIDETVYVSARNGGEIDLVFRQQLRDKIRVLLLLDNGGASMLPWVHLTRLLFTKLRDRFQDLQIGYFHNTIYGTVYSDPQRSKPLHVPKLLQGSRETRLLILGDACMAPSELMAQRGALSWGADDEEPSIVWLERLRERFRHSVWLNPIPKDAWAGTYGRHTLHRIAEVFPMEDLTLRGIQAAVDQLNR